MAKDTISPMDKLRIMRRNELIKKEMEQARKDKKKKPSAKLPNELPQSRKETWVEKNEIKTSRDYRRKGINKKLQTKVR